MGTGRLSDGTVCGLPHLMLETFAPRCSAHVVQLVLRVRSKITQRRQEVRFPPSRWNEIIFFIYFYFLAHLERFASSIFNAGNM